MLAENTFRRQPSNDLIFFWRLETGSWQLSTKKGDPIGSPSRKMIADAD
jgi:hypothetical protein